MLASQDHKCLICGTPLQEKRRCIDHNHKTGEVRGILCVRCNTGLAYIEDTNFSTEAIKYLQRDGYGKKE